MFFCRVVGYLLNFSLGFERDLAGIGAFEVVVGFIRGFVGEIEVFGVGVGVVGVVDLEF